MDILNQGQPQAFTFHQMYNNRGPRVQRRMGYSSVLKHLTANQGVAVQLLVPTALSQSKAKTACVEKCPRQAVEQHEIYLIHVFGESFDCFKQ